MWMDVSAPPLLEVPGQYGSSAALDINLPSLCSTSELTTAANPAHHVCVLRACAMRVPDTGAVYTLVPAPGAVTLAGLGALLAVRRKR